MVGVICTASRPLAVLAACATIASCSGLPPEPPADISLVSLLDAGQAVFTGTGGAEAPKRFRRSPRGQGWSGHTPMPLAEDHFESRESVAFPTGGTLRFRVELPPAPVFETGLGYWIPSDVEIGPDPEPMEFVVIVEDTEGTRATVLEAAVDVGRHEPWKDHSSDLAAWSGKTVTIELTARGDPSLWSAWGHGVISSRQPPGGRRHTKRPDVLLISLDTLRADALGCYGNERPTSPYLDRLAAEGFLFRQAVSQAPWTRPAHNAMLTGYYPSARPETGKQPIAQLLRESGYRTLALTAGGQLHPDFGFTTGFDRYWVTDWLRDPEPALDWWRDNAGRPRFLFLHTYEIHDPYSHHELAEGLERGRLGESFGKRNWRAMKSSGEPITEDERRYVRALYDSGVAFTDRMLGRTLDALGDLGMFADTLIIITSDHGEQFWEHDGWRHGQTLYDHQLLVPLIMHIPPKARQLEGNGKLLATGTVEQQVELIDLVPTVIDILGLGDLTGWVQGRSLRPALEGGHFDPREAFAEHTNIRSYERKAIRTDRFKYVHSFPRQKTKADLEPFAQLFDLVADPAEQHDIASEHPALVERFQARLAEIRQSAQPSESPEQIPDEIDPALRERLEALGYINDDDDGR